MVQVKKFSLLVFFLFSSMLLTGQTVKVKKEKSAVKSESIEGFAVELDAPAAEVNAYYLKFLKTMGKVKQSDGITVNEPNLNGLAYVQPLFASVKDNGTKSTAWIGINPKTWEKADVEKVNKELEKIMYDFGVKFYRDRIQVQVDESLRAVQAVEKQQQRLVNENKNLNAKLEDNKREKVQLEKSLENNKLQHESLLLKIEQNKKAQDSVAIAGEQVKKVVEIHRDKQRRVN
jgi:hypothetical protein